MEENEIKNQDEAIDGDDVVNGGVGVGDAEEEGQPNANDDPYGIKKRLGMQAKKHQREMRMMQEQLQALHARIGEPQAQYSNDSQPFSSPGQPNPASMSEDDKIKAAVKYALGMKEHEENQRKHAERAQHIQKQYQRLNSEFDKAAEKYDDFDEVVRGDDVPFTQHVRDALLLVDNPADVAYRLGQNRSELERIANLHPLDQAREVNKLSFALMNNGGKPQSTAKAQPLGQLKSNPANASGAVTDKTPASVIRARMKAGTWKWRSKTSTKCHLTD